jgi:hypothetical protein
MKNELNTCFQQKFATGSYGVGIGRAWCSRKACEICSSLVQKKNLEKNNFSAHKLPKQQSTSFWSQGILGVNIDAHNIPVRQAEFHKFPICGREDLLRNVPFFSTHSSKEFFCFEDFLADYFSMCPQPSFQTSYQLI